VTRFAIIGLGAAGLCLLLGLRATIWPIQAAGDTSDAVVLNYKAIPLSSADLKETRVGDLIYRGGIQIKSPDGRFGGWSGLLVSADGKRMLSQSDEGHWLRANLLYDKRGYLAGIADGELADMQALDGSKLAPKSEADAEGLAPLSDKGPDGPVAISFERDARIWRYDVSGSLDVPPADIPAPAEIKTLDFNSGLEGLTRFNAETLFAVAEIPQVRNSDHPAWLIPIPEKGHNRPFERLGVKEHPPYEISDAEMSPDGRELYLLERHYFGPFGGVVVAVRQVPASDVKPGARLDGQEIAHFTMHENIDNMEGLASRRDFGGHTLLYMISDDNYNLTVQRTVLLMFEVEG
jgi:hypothetical protein